MPPSAHHQALIAKLETIAERTDADKDAISSLPLSERSFGPGSEVVSEGDRPSSCCLLLEGFMHGYRWLPNGQRQVMSYHLPGDIPELQSLHLPTMDHSLGTVTASKVALIPHSAVRALVAKRPNVASAFWRDTLIDAAIFREWIVNVGARPARPRIAHLLCELFTRMIHLGLAEESGFTLQRSGLSSTPWWIE